ncbi:MAG TPA: VWA domain-containing protein [Bryobacteraceae bacterium]|jgi:VWFA-related protein|nr:VWA domain-containing protein [Bryobacteraceae bacterium]
MRIPSRFALGICALGIAAAQTGTPPEQAETTTKEEPATFKAKVNLVMVPVVVRDKSGRAIGTLKQEDFQLFDKGKPQFISRFSIEQPAASPNGVAKRSGAKAGVEAEGEAAPLEMPERYIAYVFDDVHIKLEDLVRGRDAAWKHISTSLRAADRAAIYTTSGRDILEFTDDKDKLHATLLRLFPHPIARGPTGTDCPDVSYYMGDLIENKNDPTALRAAVMETMACAHLDPTMASAAASMARAAASRAIASGEQESHVTLGVLRDIVRRMGALPGQRSMILVSPGFITPQLEQERNEVMERAIKANITISALDARGLWTDPGYDASQQSYSAAATMLKNQFAHEEAVMNADVLEDLAYGTGGSVFQNNNDLAEGFRKLAAVPEYIYLLGFSPQNLKLDGSYHGLKVTVKTAGLSVTARKGYFAPRHLADPIETAREELREAVFSREEMHELPITLHTQFFKPSNETARVTVLAHIDLKTLRFRKADGRNYNDLTIVSALFDRNGNWVTGSEKTLEMRLRDQTLEKRAETGFTIRTTFDVKPGGYLIRLVVRDKEGQEMSAQNGAVEIP